jgi:transcription elongation factor Elf1
MGYKLPSITKKHIDWAIKKTMPKYVVISRKTTFCLECGHKWKQSIDNLQKVEKCICPHCNQKLELCKDHTIDKVIRYFAVFT